MQKAALLGHAVVFVITIIITQASLGFKVIENSGDRQLQMNFNWNGNPKLIHYAIAADSSKAGKCMH